jgi:hypothetical protein
MNLFGKVAHFQKKSHAFLMQCKTSLDGMVCVLSVKAGIKVKYQYIDIIQLTIAK